MIRHRNQNDQRLIHGLRHWTDFQMNILHTFESAKLFPSIFLFLDILHGQQFTFSNIVSDLSNFTELVSLNQKHYYQLFFLESSDSTCKSIWCEGYGMLFILLVFTYGLLFYFQVIKRYFGRSISKNCDQLANELVNILNRIRWTMNVIYVWFSGFSKKFAFYSK